VTDYFDLGSYAREVTTSSAQAQLWFTRGLVWTYAFNHEEAVRCFERAIDSDPGCALAHWGLAYALGPNYNKPWEFFDAVDLASSVAWAHAASAAAADHADGASPVERALVHALAARYPSAKPAPDCSAWNTGYADAMRAVYRSYPDDLDVAALFADALMNLTPWALWDQATGEPAAGSGTIEAKEVLDRALARDDARTHPGILHMYIHLMEMSPRPEDALRVGDWLLDLVPDAGHLRHMPTHLDVLCGDYRRVVSANTAAIAADEKFRDRAGAMNFYTLYRVAAMLDGELEYRQGHYDEAFAHLRRAVELDDGLPYDEPWAWMQPARHAYGALLLEQDRVAEAEAVYRADLGLDATLARACQHPGNVWSLHGYHECLTRLGRREQAGIIGQQLKIAAAYADVPVRSSCYCRTTPQITQR
jgi:tetratricopeptide (TPR) repeat protein